jgi:hypothetical protein
VSTLRPRGIWTGFGLVDACIGFGCDARLGFDRLGFGFGCDARLAFGIGFEIRLGYRHSTWLEIGGGVG